MKRLIWKYEYSNQIISKFVSHSFLISVYKKVPENRPSFHENKPKTLVFT